MHLLVSEQYKDILRFGLNVHTYVVESHSLIFMCFIFSQVAFIFSGPKIGPYGVYNYNASFLDCISDLEFLVVTLGIPRMIV